MEYSAAYELYRDDREVGTVPAGGERGGGPSA
jgi:hypothetical protein